MFKKFNQNEDITGSTQLKSSMQKGIRNRIVELYPHLADYINEILPKKDNFKVFKCKEHVELVANSEGVVQFVKMRDIDYFPTLKLLHQYPFMMPWQQVDKGATKFVLSGANIMCPGLTSKGALMTPGMPANSVVAIMVEGKQHAVAIGLMKMSTEEIKQVNKGIGVDTIHYLNDGIWNLTPLK